jgi:hypothetical protein
MRRREPSGESPACRVRGARFPLLHGG